MHGGLDMCPAVQLNSFKHSKHVGENEVWKGKQNPQIQQTTACTVNTLKQPVMRNTVRNTTTLLRAIDSLFTISSSTAP